MNINFNQLAFQLFYYTNFLLLSILVPFVILLFILLLCRRFDMNSKGLFVFAMFFQMDTNDIIYIINISSKYLLIISAILFNMHVGLLFFFILLAMTLTSSLVYLNIKSFFFDFLNNLFIIFSLILLEYLRSDLDRIRIENWTLIAAVLVACFLLLYNSYFFLRSILSYLKRKRIALNERVLDYEKKD